MLSANHPDFMVVSFSGYGSGEQNKLAHFTDLWKDGKIVRFVTDPDRTNEFDAMAEDILTTSGFCGTYVAGMKLEKLVAVILANVVPISDDFLRKSNHGNPVMISESLEFARQLLERNPRVNVRVLDGILRGMAARLERV